MATMARRRLGFWQRGRGIVGIEGCSCETDQKGEGSGRRGRLGRARGGDALGAAKGTEAIRDRGKKSIGRDLLEKVDCGCSSPLECRRLDVGGRGYEELGEGAALR